MSYDVAALPFQAHANYGTWSIDFELNILSLRHNDNYIVNLNGQLYKLFYPYTSILKGIHDV